MFRYLVAALAAIYAVLLVFGDDARRPEVTRNAGDVLTGFSLASFAVPATPIVERALASGPTDSEAVQIAIEAGQARRAHRGSQQLLGTLDAPRTAIPETVALATPEAPGLWYVTGERVNLRSGPGTGNEVVAQLVLGDAAEVLSDENGWFRIRTADGATHGWISGKFLSETKPG